MGNYFDSWFSYEALLTATWSSGGGVVVTSSVLPVAWTRALERIGRDLRVRRFNGAIAHIRFEAEHRQVREDDEQDYVWLSSEVTPEDGVPHGMGHSGEGVLATAGEEAVAVSCANLVQDQVERTGIMWPRGRAGGAMGAVLIGGVATWSGRDGEQAAVGSLPA
ncbi:hypothetical protein [Gordonia polyisoprenivorans]|uniref:hypothetical protein n=1 Tax=Gordonia polyisoprenivorans TaxID=84595 RepID=UPI001AD6B46A|nr:hypothetical protein [Gordonia polyisoprenivorans]QTI67285.1 hypothetical protein J6U32_16860 [Gordonia polyisoprenivorans]